MNPSDASRLPDTATFLDVREPYEYEAGHIPGSLHIPIGEIRGRAAELEGREPIVVVCQVGQRSALVADFLKQRGLDAENLDGGLEAWMAEGLEVEGPFAGPGEVIEGRARGLDGPGLTDG